MSPADQHDEPGPDAEPESQPPPADPEVREALDRMEADREVPDAEDVGRSGRGRRRAARPPRRG